jgi:hypothetical protein
MESFDTSWFRGFEVFKEWGSPKSSSCEVILVVGCRRKRIRGSRLEIFMKRDRDLKKLCGASENFGKVVKEGEVDIGH